MLDKLFGWSKKEPGSEPRITFGRYSDNNKTVEKTNRWTDADNLNKEKSITTVWRPSLITCVMRPLIMCG